MKTRKVGALMNEATMTIWCGHPHCDRPVDDQRITPAERHLENGAGGIYEAIDTVHVINLPCGHSMIAKSPRDAVR